MSEGYTIAVVIGVMLFYLTIVVHQALQQLGRVIDGNAKLLRDAIEKQRR